MNVGHHVEIKYAFNAQGPPYTVVLAYVCVAHSEAHTVCTRTVKPHF